MKKIVMVLLLTILFSSIMVDADAAVLASGSYKSVNVYVFTEKDCKDCAKQISYIEELKEDNSSIIINEISVDDNKDLYATVKETLKIKSKNLPLVVIGSNYFTGSNKELKKAINAYYDSEDSCDVVSTIKQKGDVNKCIKTNDEIYKQVNNIPIIVTITLVIAIVVGLTILVIVKKRDN